jgi:Ca2+-binding RTX toxin-like protein
VVEGDINFNISGGTIADIITAGSGADTISGGAGDDSLTGGAGADVISTTSGADTVVGGAGADSMTGGTGVDIFRWAATTAATFATEAATNAGAAATFAAGTVGDTVLGFTTGTDKLYFAAAGVTNAIGTEIDTLLSIAKAGTVTNVARFVRINDSAAADAVDTVAGAVVILNALTTTAVAIGDSFIVAMDNDTDTFLYYVKQISTADTIAAQDVTLIGRVNGVTTANGDFVSF